MGTIRQHMHAGPYVIAGEGAWHTATGKTSQVPIRTTPAVAFPWSGPAVDASGAVAHRLDAGSCPRLGPRGDPPVHAPPRQPGPIRIRNDLQHFALNAQCLPLAKAYVTTTSFGF